MQKHPTNLLNLQNLMKRDPGSYVEEFTTQWQAYLHQYQLLQLPSPPPASLLTSFTSLLTFLSHVAPCFPTLTAPLPTHLLLLLTQHSSSLTPHLRLTIVQALILLQNRSMVSRFTLLPTFFTLFSIPDKPLRALLFSHIVADIRRVNRHRKDVKLNAALQAFLFSLMTPSAAAAEGGGRAADDGSMAAKKSLDVMIDLWRRRVWTDEKTVHVISLACFSPHTRIMVAALRFFLGLPFYDDEAEEEEEERGTKNLSRKAVALKAEAMKGVVKRRKKRQREIKRATRRLNRDSHAQHTDVEALQLIHDPQAFAERLFARLRSSTASFPVRLLLLNVVSRLVGAHQLLLLQLYPFVQKYMQPHQRHVTVILTYLAQATHRLVPPDVLRPLVLTLAGHFVTDRSSAEVMMVGINAIREVCARQPLVMTRSLLMDLAGYKKHRVKGVMMASRSLIGLFRERMPGLLRRRERGKFVSEAARKEGEEGEERDDEYAKLEYATDVAGAELLRKKEEEEGGEADGRGEDEWDMKEEEGADEDEEDDEDEDAVTAGEVDAFLASLDGDDEEAEVDEDEDEDSGGAVEKRMVEEAEQLEGEIDQEVDGDSGEDDDSDHEGEESVDEEDEDDAENPAEEPIEKKQRVSFNLTVQPTSNPSPSAPLEPSSSVPSAPSAPSVPFAATRIFTPKDFALLRQLRHAAATPTTGRSRSKRPLPSADGDAVEEGGVVDVEAIKGYRARKRLSKEERLESVREGRADGRGGGKEKGGGSTNAEKLKAKPFMLIRHSTDVRSKQRQSFSAVQQKQQTHIKNLKNQGKKAKRKIRQKRGY